MKVAVLQMNVAFGQPDKNIASFYRLAEQAMEARPDVLLLPELWQTGFYPQPILSYADADGQQTRAALSALARRYQVNIVGGTAANAIGPQVFNTCYVFDRSGHLTATYHKAHLFTPSGEKDDFHAGDSAVTFLLDGVPCGLAVCYDIRFPELVRRLALEGIAVLFVPAAWPLPRLIHWQTLLRARAIENQIFVAACNESGTGANNLQLAGHSVLIDPWGEILAEAGEDETILHGSLRPVVRHQIKKEMDVLADRREKLYERKK